MGCSHPCCVDDESTTKKNNNNNINNDKNKKLIQEEDKIKIYDKKKKDKQKLIDKQISNHKLLITVIFRESDGYIEHLLTCNESDIFSTVEKKLYEACPGSKGINNPKMSGVLNNLKKLFPKLMKNNNYNPNSMIGNKHIRFYVNGINIDKSKTLKKNNIKDNTIILFDYSDFNQINVNFILDYPEINYKIPCYDIYLFSTIEQKLYNEYPDLEEKNIIFKVEGNKLDKSLTLNENNIKNIMLLFQ